jgi:rSAM/selenodomain-associated transferase 2
MPPLVSVVVPILGDAVAAADLFRHLPVDPRLEILLVDGSADGRYDEGAARVAGSRPDARLLRTAAGRARQMNAGAERATGEWLLFLHADSSFQGAWLEAIAGLPPDVAGGWFRFALDDAAWQARMIERGVRWRVRHWQLPYGDQGIFVRRQVFTAMSGYRDLPLMEDVDFVRRLVRTGRTCELPVVLVTSARRWRQDGWFRRSARNLALVTLYLAGVPAASLARWYGRRPSPP